MGIGSLVFSETQHGVRGTCGAVHNRAGFFDVFLSNYGENGPKMFFFKFVVLFSLYYLLYSCTNPILGKNLVPEIWTKMLSTNQIAGFLI